MKDLLVLEKEITALFILHKSKCIITAQMTTGWQLELPELSEKYSHPELGIAIHDLTSSHYKFHNNVHEKWLLHPAIDLSHPDDHSLLKDLMTDEDRYIFVRDLLVGYDLLMSLPSLERKDWWMKFHLSLKNKNNKPNCYVIGIRVYKFDEFFCPWLMINKIVRLSAAYVPSEKHYCEYSHSINRDIRRIYKVKQRIVKPLTKMEAEVLKLGNEGYSIEETAEIMESNAKRIKNARERIYRKTNTHSIEQAYRYVQKHDLADLLQFIVYS